MRHNKGHVSSSKSVACLFIASLERNHAPFSRFLQFYSLFKEFGEGVDRLCRELSVIGTKGPQYHLAAFIMKASVWANVLEEGQETAREGQENNPSDPMEGDATQKNYPEKLPRK